MQYNHQGNNDEFRGLEKFHRNKSLTLKGIYDLEGEQAWLGEIEKIFLVVACIEVHKV